MSWGEWLDASVAQHRPILEALLDTIDDPQDQDDVIAEYFAAISPWVASAIRCQWHREGAQAEREERLSPDLLRRVRMCASAAETVVNLDDDALEAWIAS